MTITPHEITSAWGDLIRVRPYGADREIITMPWAYGSGRVLTLLTERMSPDVYTVSDAGLSASELADCGVDVSSQRAVKSWNAVLRHMDVPPSMTAKPWEIQAETDRAGLSHAINVVAEACLRADGLSVLAAPASRRSFSERVTSTIAGAGLTVVPLARIPVRHGGARHVTCLVENEGKRDVFVWALSANDQNLSHDRAYSVFGGAVGSLRREQLVSAVEGALAHWEAPLLRSLEEVSVITAESGLVDAVRTAAA